MIKRCYKNLVFMVIILNLSILPIFLSLAHSNSGKINKKPMSTKHLVKKSGAVKDSSSIINSKAGIMLLSQNGTILYSQNPNIGFIPASTIKVLTSLVARHYLGVNYRFTTDFFLTVGAQNRDNLKIKGYGDPLFTSALIHDACRQVVATLRAMNINQLNDIVVDNSFFTQNINIDGRSNTNNPYDAPVGALSANFNTVSFQYSRSKKEYVSDDPEIPLLPFVMNQVKSSRLRGGRVVLSQEESRLYAGMLIRHFLLQEGILIRGDVKAGIVTSKDKPIYKFISPYSIDEIIVKLLKHSSNFIANQIFLASGAKAFSPPATVEKGVAAMSDYVKRAIGISMYSGSNVIFAEGSGLSRLNRISPADMVKILFKFRPNYQLMRSETIADGVTEYYKTGTLNGVRTRCGYFETLDGLYPFVIMVNQDGAGYENIRKSLCEMVLLHKNASIQNFFSKTQVVLNF
ncbi:MAG: D-alanyl-D-alanine carboxypeptidase [Desulfamplus sp.]|nr:D-alanyl-D-alanine carboxypeptidase [Desulfamplus sp.]